jgi:hypothetical protein
MNIAFCFSKRDIRGDLGVKEDGRKLVTYELTTCAKTLPETIQTRKPF